MLPDVSILDGFLRAEFVRKPSISLQIKHFLKKNFSYTRCCPHPPIRSYTGPFASTKMRLWKLGCSTNEKLGPIKTSLFTISLTFITLFYYS